LTIGVQLSVSLRKAAAHKSKVGAVNKEAITFLQILALKMCKLLDKFTSAGALAVKTFGPDVTAFDCRFSPASIMVLFALSM
jgi:hypothetical protein